MKKIFTIIFILLMISCKRNLKETDKETFYDKREKAIINSVSKGNNKFLLNDFRIGWKKEQFIEKIRELEDFNLGKIVNDSLFYIYIPDFNNPNLNLDFRIEPWTKKNDSLKAISISMSDDNYLYLFSNFKEIISRKYGEPLLLKLADQSQEPENIYGITLYPHFSSKSTWIKGNLIIDLKESFYKFEENSIVKGSYFLYIQYHYLPDAKKNITRIIRSRKNEKNKELDIKIKEIKKREKLDSIRNSIF